MRFYTKHYENRLTGRIAALHTGTMNAETLRNPAPTA